MLIYFGKYCSGCSVKNGLQGDGVEAGSCREVSVRVPQRLCSLGLYIAVEMRSC